MTRLETLHLRFRPWRSLGSIEPQLPQTPHAFLPTLSLFDLRGAFEHLDNLIAILLDNVTLILFGQLRFTLPNSFGSSIRSQRSMYSIKQIWPFGATPPRLCSLRRQGRPIAQNLLWRYHAMNQTSSGPWWSCPYYPSPHWRLGTAGHLLGIIFTVRMVDDGMENTH